MAVMMRPELSVKELVDELWQVAQRYGFRATPHSFENGRIQADFERRICRFILAYVHFKPGQPLPQILLDNTLTCIRAEILKREVVALDLINELALVWGLIFLKHGYRHLSQDVGVDALKLEVLWLLKRFEYRTPERCERFCTALSDWGRHEVLWRAVRDYNACFKFDASAPKPVIPQHPACQECLLALAACQ